MIALWPSGSHQELSLADPYGTSQGITMVTGTVTGLQPRDCGPEAGTLETPTGGMAGDPGASGESDYVFVDFERTVPVVVLALLYALVVVAVARWRGLRAIVGLGLAFTVLFGFMFPALLEGGPPL